MTGENGAGKTSLVEALYLACLGVSPRTTRDAEIVGREASALHIELDLDGPAGLQRRGIGIAPRQGRRLSVNGELASSLRAWRAVGSALVFVPDELRAVKGPPAARRRHLDRLLEAAAPGYATALSAYQEALVQRNALLRRIRAGLTGAEGLDPWDAQLARYGAIVATARTVGVDALRTPFAHYLAALGGADGGELRLECSPRERNTVDSDDTETSMRDELRDRRTADIRAAQTLLGPHRDDLFIGAAGADLRRLGSQGEQRTAVLALLLAHCDHLASTNAQPILILDDGLSELDPGRRERLLSNIGRHGQAIVTSADPGTAELAGSVDAQLITVRDGHVATSP